MGSKPGSSGTRDAARVGRLLPGHPCWQLRDEVGDPAGAFRIASSFRRCWQQLPDAVRIGLGSRWDLRGLVVELQERLSPPRERPHLTVYGEAWPPEDHGPDRLGFAAGATRRLGADALDALMAHEVGHLVRMVRGLRFLGHEDEERAVNDLAGGWGFAMNRLP
jgi:hypothetical protein